MILNREKRAINGLTKKNQRSQHNSLSLQGLVAVVNKYHIVAINFHFKVV